MARRAGLPCSGVGRIVLESDALRLAIDAELGAAIVGLWCRHAGRHATGAREAGDWAAVLRPAPAGASHFNDTSCYLLAPWANRIAGARFRFRGRDVALAPSWPDGTAIHGEVCRRRWRILDRSPVSARLGVSGGPDGSTAAARAAPGCWPWRYDAVARYELDGARLVCDLSLTNADSEPMPAGVGFHPFFVRSSRTPDGDVRVRAACSGRYPLERVLPVAPAREDELVRALRAGTTLSGLVLDDVFAGFDGRAEIHWPDLGVRARFECSDALTHLVLFTGSPGAPTPDAFCLEPVSMVNDGFNLLDRGWAGTGVRVLEPGDALAVRWTLAIDRA